MAPIHFLPCSCLLPLSRRLCTHTHAIPILADHILPLPLLVVFSLTIFFHLPCIIFAHRISSSPPPPPMPSHSTGTHLIISWTPYLTIGPRCCHPFALTATPVGDSVPYYLYHSLGLWLSLPATLTLLLVSDSFLFPPAFLCTTTYSLVCAQFPCVYKPSVIQLYSLTWIYLVLHG